LSDEEGKVRKEKFRKLKAILAVFIEGQLDYPFICQNGNSNDPALVAYSAFSFAVTSGRVMCSQ
jgi:hypothetical protein